MSLHAPAQYNAVRALSFPVTSGHRGQRLWGAAPPFRSADPSTAQYRNGGNYENHHSEPLLPHLTERVMLEVSDEIAVTLSIGGRLCDSYKRRKRDHDECSWTAPRL